MSTVIGSRLIVVLSLRVLFLLVKSPNLLLNSFISASSAYFLISKLQNTGNYTLEMLTVGHSDVRPNIVCLSANNWRAS